MNFVFGLIELLIWPHQTVGILRTSKDIIVFSSSFASKNPQIKFQRLVEDWTSSKEPCDEARSQMRILEMTDGFSSYKTSAYDC